MTNEQRLQTELDRCYGLIRLLGAHDFDSLEDGIRMLVIGDEPLEFRFIVSADDIRDSINRIEEATTRIATDPIGRSAIPFEFEILQLALAFLASRLHVDPKMLLEQIGQQLLDAMHHAQESH